ncbi:MAG: hypothetical protein QOF10_4809, partial [Kribbellaceae bacterium]|nr:hypothetical protein [Kribbellaceae bacterium]
PASPTSKASPENSPKPTQRQSATEPSNYSPAKSPPQKPPSNPAPPSTSKPTPPNPHPPSPHRPRPSQQHRTPSPQHPRTPPHRPTHWPHHPAPSPQHPQASSRRSPLLLRRPHHPAPSPHHRPTPPHRPNQWPHHPAPSPHHPRPSPGRPPRLFRRPRHSHHQHQLTLPRLLQLVRMRLHRLMALWLRQHMVRRVSVAQRRRRRGRPFTRRCQVSPHRTRRLLRTGWTFRGDHGSNSQPSEPPTTRTGERSVDLRLVLAVRNPNVKCD